MPRRKSKAEGLPWPPCRKCKSKKTDGMGVPPQPCVCRCQECGEVWLICGSKTRDNKRCQNAPMLKMESVRCYMHGATTNNRGENHPNWNGGKRQEPHVKRDLLQNLPPGLLDAADEVMESANVVDLRIEIAVNQALLAEELTQLGEQPLIVTEVMAAHRDARIAVNHLNLFMGEGGDVLDDSLASLVRLHRLIERLADSERSRHKVQQYLDMARRLKQAKVDIDKEAGRLIPVEVVKHVFDGLIHTVAPMLTHEQKEGLARAMVGFGARIDWDGLHPPERGGQAGLPQR